MSKTHHDETPKPRKEIEVKADPSQVEEEHRRQEERDRKQHEYHNHVMRRVTVLSTFIAALATALTFWIGWEAHKTRIEAGDSSAKSLKLQTDVYHSDERPYVVPRPELIDMKWFDAKTTDQQVRLKFNAYGKTPAFNVVITSRCVDINEMTPHGAPKDDNQAFAALGEAEAKLPKPGPLNPFSIIPAMASGDVLYQMPCIPFRSKQQIDDEGDELFALMIGSVFYDDIFGDQHHLTYCYQVGIDYDLKLYKIPDSHPPFPGKLYASNTAGATICPYFKSIIQ